MEIDVLDRQQFQRRGRHISEEQIANWLFITFVPLRVCLCYLLLKTNITELFVEFAWGGVE
jgi:hypothetical protein